MIELNALAPLAFGLGVKHGLDPDHLAAIDGLTRFNGAAQPRLARFCGALFSLGHGSVVIAVAIAAISLTQRWTPPDWLNFVGSGGAIAVLAALGVANLYAVLRTPEQQIVRVVGFRSHWFARLFRASNPVTICLLGALFALSFDTISQGLMFAMIAGHADAWREASLLGVCFTLGMMLTDGVNGIWIAHLILKADRNAAIASRAMSVLIAAISLLTAGLGATTLAFPAVETWTSNKQFLLGLAITTVITAGYGLMTGSCARAAAVSLLNTSKSDPTA